MSTSNGVLVRVTDVEKLFRRGADDLDNEGLRRLEKEHVSSVLINAHPRRVLSRKVRRRDRRR